MLSSTPDTTTRYMHSVFDKLKESFYQIPSNPDALDCVFSQLKLKPSGFQSPEEFIQAQTRIRVPMDGGPGYGNQAATINLINRLSQMGFRGVIELIHSKQILDKIHTLFSISPKTEKKTFPHHNLTIELIDIDELVIRRRENQLNTVTLAITGAADIKLPFSFLNTKMVVHLSAYYRQTLGDTSIFLKNNDVEIIQENSKDTALIVPIATLQEVEEYLMSDSGKNALTTKASALLSFITALKKRIFFNFLPAYGYPLHELSNHFLKLLLGARFAQLNSSIKPLVIGLFFNASTLVRDLQELLRGINPTVQYQEALTAEEQLNLQIAADLEFLEWANVTQVYTLKKSAIVIFNLGSLPKIIFDALFSHKASNTWPSVREGASSLTTLLRSGKPHLHCEYSTRWEIDMHLADPVLQKELKALSLCSDDYSPVFDQIKATAKFILESNNNSSPTSRFFIRQKKYSSQPKNDRIKNALAAAMHLSTYERPSQLSPILQQRFFDWNTLSMINQKSSFTPIQPCICLPHSKPPLEQNYFPLNDYLMLGQVGLHQWKKSHHYSHRLSASQREQLKIYQKNINRIADSFVWQQNNYIASTPILEDSFNLVEKLLISLKQDIKKVLAKNRITKKLYQEIEYDYQRLQTNFHHIANKNHSLKQLLKKSNIKQARKERRMQQANSSLFNQPKATDHPRPSYKTNKAQAFLKQNSATNPSQNQSLLWNERNVTQNSALAFNMSNPLLLKK